MRFPRSSGILLHPTSLPGAYGIGDLGPWAFRFVDMLADAGQTFWQTLPLGPTGYGDSPYQCFSAFAGNPLLISPDSLLQQGHLAPADLNDLPEFASDSVDFGRVIAFKSALLRRAFESFASDGGCRDATYLDFCARAGPWLDDFALFMALKEHHAGREWTAWEPELVSRRPEALAGWRDRLASTIEYHRYLQYEFHRQWTSLRDRAHSHGILLVGDIPIFVAHDSADVWSHPEFFYLDDSGRPTVVAGVPPDYFSETGQLWGNPLYRWEQLAETGFEWWVDRFRTILEMVDVIRLDHFRGFEAYWEVSAREQTAVRGRWVKAPGAALLSQLKRSLGTLPIIAEDLGVITPGVEALRDSFELPGMRILQFAFCSDSTNPFLPHNYVHHCVAYTGTHDNDTTIGWFDTCTALERQMVQTYCATDGGQINWVLIHWLMASIADVTVLPLQDILGLGTKARMNYPSRLGGNWSWRFAESELTPGTLERVRRLSECYGRLPLTASAPDGP